MFSRGHAGYWRIALSLGCAVLFVCNPLAAQQGPAPVNPGVNLPAPITPGGVQPERTVPRPGARELPDDNVLPESAPSTGVGDDAGPRVVIDSIQVVDAPEYPDLGITADGLQAMADEAVASRKDWSIDELHQLVNGITDAYREQGFILTQAFLPEQSIADGSAEIRVIEGTLGEILVEGNNRYRSETLVRLFSPMVDDAVTQSELESALLHARDLPGIRARGLLQRGSREGTADLLYQVEEEDRFDAYLTLDNFGSEYVGDKRGRIDLVALNPTGRGDRLTLSGLMSFDPSNSDYFGVDYSIPYIRKKNGKPVYLGLSGSNNTFEVGGDLADLGLDGESHRIDLYARYPYLRSRYQDRTLLAGLSSKSSQTHQNDVSTALDELTVLFLGNVYSYQNQAMAGGVSTLTASWSHGIGDFLGSMDGENARESSRLGGNGKKAGGDFDKFNFNTTLFQRLNQRLSLQLRLDGQYSDDLLVSLEQFPLGGPNSVRAYPLSSYLMDSGWFVSAELSVGIYRGLQASVFYDHGGGDLNDPLPSDIASVDLGGAGIGLRYDLGTRFTLAASLARPVGDTAPGFDAEEDENQFFISLNAKLR